MNLIAQITGWIGASAFIFSDVFIAHHILKHKKTDIPLHAVLAVLTGAIGNLVHEILMKGSISQMVAFGLTSACWGCALYFKLRK